MRPNGGVLEKWSISYEIGVSDCDLELARDIDTSGDVKGLRLQLRSDTPKRSGAISEFDFFLDVRTVKENDFLVYPRWNAVSGVHTTTTLNQNKKTNKSGTVTDIDMYLYGEGHKGGLIVLERKKKSGHILPYELTLVHYHATGSGINDYRNIRPDFGLSIVAKIRSNGGNLSVMVDGPEQHPSSALLYMFDEVSRNGIWYHEMCPHCAKNPKKQNEEWEQSESEDTDSSPKAPSLLGGSTKNARVISNGGKFGGDGNGNFYERNIFNFFQHERPNSKYLGGRT